MANYGIRIKDVEIPDISIKDVALVEVFIKDVQVWEEASSGGEIVTLQIVDDGDGSGGGPNVPPLYTVPQLSSDGSGTGAEFNITVTFNSQKWIMTVTAASIDSDNPGSGYAVGEIVTLDMSSVYGSWSEPEIEVLTVTT